MYCSNEQKGTLVYSPNSTVYLYTLHSLMYSYVQFTFCNASVHIRV